jgi:uncharacterized protein (TIGR03067 family)
MTTSVLLSLALCLGAPALKDPPAKPNPLAGVWVLESMAVSGVVQREPADNALRCEFTSDGKWMRYRDDRKLRINGRYSIDLKADPSAIDLKPQAAFPAVLAIFKVEGDTLTICSAQDKRKDRPTSFELPEDSQTLLEVFKRVKKKE